MDQLILCYMMSNNLLLRLFFVPLHQLYRVLIGNHHRITRIAQHRHDLEHSLQVQFTHYKSYTIELMIFCYLYDCDR